MMGKNQNKTIKRSTMPLSSSCPLVQRKRVGIKVVDPGIVRSLVKDTVHSGAVVGPKGAEGPGAELAGLSLVITRQDGGVQEDGLDAVLDPVNHSGKVGLGEGAVGLLAVDGAMGSTGDEVEAVKLVEGLAGLVEGHVGVHNLAHGLAVVDGGGGGHTGVGFAVEVDDLAAALLDVGQIGVVDLEGVLVLGPGELHPVADGIVGHVVEGAEGGEVLELDELGNELAAVAVNVENPRIGGGVVLGGGIVKVGTGLIGEVGLATLAVLEAVQDSLGDLDTELGDGSVLSGRAGGAAELALAEAETQAAAAAGRARVRGTDERADVEVELAEVRTGNDTIRLSVHGVAGVDGGVDNQGQLAGGRVVIEGLLDDVGGQVVDLLLSKAEGGSTDDDTVVVGTETLGLGPTLTATLGAGLVVGVDLVGGGVEVLAELTADQHHLVDALVGHHVGVLPVDGAVGDEEDIVKGLSVEATVGQTGSRTVHDTAGQRAAGGSTLIDIVGFATRGEETVLEVGRGRHPVGQGNGIVETNVGVVEGDGAVLDGSSGEEAGAGDGDVVIGSDADGARVDGEAQDGSIGREDGLHVGGGADVAEGCRIGSGHHGGGGQARVGTHGVKGMRGNQRKCISFLGSWKGNE